MTLGAPAVVGSRRKARALLTRNSKGWVSSVPKKFAGVVPLLPPSAQPLAAPPVDEIWRPLPFGVMLTPLTPIRLTESVNPFNDRTTVPLATLLARPALPAKIA